MPEPRTHAPPAVHRRTVYMTALLLAGACGGDGGTRAGAAVEDTSRAAVVEDGDATPPFALSCEGLETSILAAEPTRQGLREAFGAPDTVEVATESNRHIPGATDSLFTVRYSGLTVHLRTPPAARDLATDVAIRDNRFISDARVGIGADESDVVRFLGEPTRREAGALVYDCGDAVEQPVLFDLADGRVRAIRVQYYVD